LDLSETYRADGVDSGSASCFAWSLRSLLSTINYLTDRDGFNTYGMAGSAGRTCSRLSHGFCRLQTKIRYLDQFMYFTDFETLTDIVGKYLEYGLGTMEKIRCLIMEISALGRERREAVRRAASIAINFRRKGRTGCVGVGNILCHNR